MATSTITPNPSEGIPLQTVAVELSFAAQYINFVKSQGQTATSDEKTRAKALLLQLRNDVIAAIDGVTVPPPPVTIPLLIVAVEFSFAVQYVSFLNGKGDTAGADALLQQCRNDAIASIDSAAASVGVDPLVGEQ